MIPSFRTLLVPAVALTMVGAASAGGGRHAVSRTVTTSHTIHAQVQHVGRVGIAKHTVKAGLHRHYVQSWCGWSKRCWWPQSSCWVYWSPVDCCWYRYVTSTAAYVPCEGLPAEIPPQ